MNVELVHLPLTEAGVLLRARRFTAQEFLRAHLERIQEVDPRLHSFITVMDETAANEATQADRRLMRQAPLSPLDGIPIALKDMIDVAGVPTTANSRVRPFSPARQDATIVKRLRAGGAVLIGKLQMNEFAMGPVQESDLRPPARNPWDRDRTAGSSSSGSASAVAADLCVGSIGSDTGGSIRGPASYCGVVGLKPTFGRVSRSGTEVLSWSLEHVGPLARRVADVAALLQVIAGHDPADPFSSDTAVPTYGPLLRDAHGVRIGVPEDCLEAKNVDLHSEVEVAFRDALTILRDLGAEVRVVAFPHREHVRTIQQVILFSEALAHHMIQLREQGASYGQGFRQRVLRGLFLSGADHVLAQRGRAMLNSSVQALMTDVDLLALPTMPTTAPTFAEAAKAPTDHPFLFPFAVTGQPAVSVPCGFDGAGRPIGLQLAGRHFDELTVLRVAAAFEQATTWHLRRPLLS